MRLSPQLFPRSLAEALSALLQQRYRTAKIMARAVGIDVRTAENLYRGHLSVPTLQKLLAHEGRELWNRLGDDLFGETFYEYEERRIQAEIAEAEHGLTNIRRLRSKGEELLASAVAVEQVGYRQAAPADRDREGRTWAAADGRSAQGTSRSRDRGGR